MDFTAREGLVVREKGSTAVEVMSQDRSKGTHRAKRPQRTGHARTNQTTRPRWNVNTAVTQCREHTNRYSTHTEHDGARESGQRKGLDTVLTSCRQPPQGLYAGRPHR